MIEHPRDVIPIVHLFCEGQKPLIDLLNERFEEIDATNGKNRFCFRWRGIVIRIAGEISGLNNNELVEESETGFMYIESIFN